MAGAFSIMLAASSKARVRAGDFALHRIVFAELLVHFNRGLHLAVTLLGVADSLAEAGSGWGRRRAEKALPNNWRRDIRR